MNKRRERTLQDICDATSAPSNPDITPVLRGNCKMHVAGNEANSVLLTHTVTSQITEDLRSRRDRSQKFEYRGKGGACNVCSAPCSSCFHASKVLMNSTDEPAGETCADNVLVGLRKQLETRKFNEISTVSGMHSNSESFSENAVGKASPRTSDAYASDDNVVHSKFEGQRVPEEQDDCLSCVSGADERANKESDIENSGLMEIPPSKATDDATDLGKVHNTLSQASYGKSMPHESSRIEYNKLSQTKGRLMEGSSEPLISSLIEEVKLDDVCDEPLAMAQKSIKGNDDMEMEIQPTDETDDSDMVEHDVKVCDICGDAGREEMLAICGQCSDGAEHTYCMGEMLDEVPEGDWLCEECRSAEQVRNEPQEKIERIDGFEKNISSGLASGEYVNSSEVEGHRSKVYMENTGKRLRDDVDAEVTSKVKRSAIESIVKSPKASVSNRAATLSRELSSRNLDKNSLQSQLDSSSDPVQVSSIPESASIVSDPRVKEFRGTFSKSSSFSSLNSKPKVKLVDQIVFQKQKSVREYSSFHLKESVARSTGKSMSFKSLNSSRSESKMETLSPRLSHTQDSKTTKQRSSFERQSSCRKEHSSMKSVLGTTLSSTSKIEKKLASRDMSSSLTNTANHHEVKPVRTDGRSAALSRSSSHIGEFKRPSLHSHTALGPSSASGDNSEQKNNQISPKENFSSHSAVAEKAPFNANEGLLDGLSRHRDSSNPGGRVSGGRFRPPGAKSSAGENDSLKAAIEAAVLRKPDLYRKHRPLGQADDSSTSAGKKQISFSAELLERQTVSRNSQGDSNKQNYINNVQQFSPVPVGGLSSVGGDGVLPLDRNYALRGTFSSVSAGMPIFLTSLAIPEHEYLWKGSFEICRSGKIVDLWDGLQAHLSTLASLKVNEAVKKFNSRIVLYEVPRLSTWPIQFQENGVREDNIALFFFAKDLESYDKIYKVMLENMMKNDLALKGDINGVELLIFPSNQLPDNCQRWNMLFFLWAVFRVKKESCLPPMPESAKQISTSPDIPSAIMSLSETRCSLSPIANDLPATDNTSSVHKVPDTKKLSSLLSSRAVSGDRDAKSPSLGTNLHSLDRSNGKLNCNSSAVVRSDGGEQCQEPRKTFLEGTISSRYGSHLQALGSAGCFGREEMLMHLDTRVDRQQSSHPFSEHAVASRNMAAEESMCKTTLDIRTSNEDELQFTKNGETPLIKDRDTIDLNMECVEPETLYAGSSQVLSGGDVACDELCGGLGKVNFEATEAFDKMEMLEYKETGDRHPFHTESFPWKISPLEQVRLHERAPSLELALGAESKPLSQVIQPLLVGNMDKMINEEHVPNEVGTTSGDDVSASLSLSLSFPFSEKDQSTKPAPSTERLVSERERANNSMLLLSGLRDD